MIRQLNAVFAGDPLERRRLQSSNVNAHICAVVPQLLNDEWRIEDGCAHDTLHVAPTEHDTKGRTYHDELNENASKAPRGYRHHSCVGDIYQPLLQPRTIRLMRINPSQESSSSLSCHLQTVHLDSLPSYEALSYRWRGQDDCVLRCSGKDLSIRQNLEDALKRIRLTNTQRAIWTDAVCINQKNEEERANQINLMQEIYSRASRVLVWLGEDPENEAKRAFDRLRQIAKARTSLPPPQDPWWNSVAAFYRNDWFSRLWVFQEVAMATAADVLWGAFRIPWKTVGRASIQMRTLFHQQILVHSMMNVYHGYLFYKWSVLNERPNPPESFLYMLQITRKLQCSNQKDRIYALSGFMTVDTCPADFYVDFGIKRRLRSVYQDFARKVLQRMQTLDVLSAVQYKPDRARVWKMTWVPRWNICTADTLAPLGSRYKKYTACQGLAPPLIEWTGNWKQFLRATGIEFGTVTRATEVIADFKSIRQMTTLLLELSDHLFTEISSYPTGESPARVCCWTLTAGKDEYGMIVENVSQHLSDFAAFRAYGMQTMEKNSRWLPCAEGIDGGNAYHFLMAARSACSGRRLFYTSNGYVGIGSATLQSGDVVCVLSGGAMPFVLRRDSRSRQSKRRFALIGEAYVHGIMYGEGVSKYCDDKHATVAFDII